MTQGRRIATCKAARAREIEERIQELLRDGLLDGGVHKKYLGLPCVAACPRALAAIGCLRCQEACPENTRHKRAVERRYVFDRQTSQALLEERPAASLAPEAAELIRLLELEGQEEKLARNLAALQARA